MLKQIVILILLLYIPIHSADDSKLKALVTKNDYVVIAEVMEVYNSTGVWNGFIPSSQSVKYRVLQTLKGKLDEDIITVAHPIFKNSKTVDKDIPQLSPKIFKTGNQLILFISNPEHQVDNKDEYIFDKEYGYVEFKYSKYYICADGYDGTCLIDYNELDHIKDLINNK